MRKRRIWILILILILAVLIGFWVWRTWFYVQPLMDLLSPEDWQSVQAEHHPDVYTDGPVVHVSPEGLAAGLEGVDLKYHEKTNFLPTPCIIFWLHTGPGGTYELVVGQDGSVTYADYSEISSTKTYWKTTEPGLYEALLPLLPESE